MRLSAALEVLNRLDPGVRDDLFGDDTGNILDRDGEPEGDQRGLQLAHRRARGVPLDQDAGERSFEDRLPSTGAR
jgi:hypothetical protein